MASQQEQAFLDALASAGIPPTGPLVLDGQLRRYNVYGQRKGKRNGWYRYVQLRDDFAYAVFGCNKTGISDKWSNRDGREITAYDKKQMRKQAQVAEHEQEEAQAKAAFKANQMWTRLPMVQQHVYATRKGIRLVWPGGGLGLRELHGSIVVPMLVDNYIVSLQFISADGGKRFLTNGQKKGTYYLLGDALPQDRVLYICEGLATACSIFEAMGTQVVVAFDAGNLVPVAEAMRRRWPAREIVMAADNDQWTRGNPGASKAQEAADRIGAKVLLPRFDPEDKTHPTDWNDFAVRYGLAALAAEIAGIKITAAVTPQQIDERSWRRTLLPGKVEVAGYPQFEAKSIENGYLFMQNHELFNGLMAYNIFSDEILVHRCPPWEDPQSFTPRRIRDTDANMWARYLERLGVKVTKGTVWDFMEVLARKNEINPPRDYFEQLRWDGRKRLDTWLTYYLGAEKQSVEYLALVGSKWLMGAVARIYYPGCKFDNVLVLEGDQGMKKTMTFETLATFNDVPYFIEFSGDVMKRDSLMLMQGKIIAEMSELASVSKSKIEEMKAFVSRKVDEYRPPYGRMTVSRPRFFVLAGTTNKVGQEYLEDETGARRIWPVECGANIDNDALRADAAQLWAEAIYRWKAGERVYLEGPEVAIVKGEQELRQAHDSWEDKITAAVKGISEITTLGICDAMGLLTKDINNQSMKRIKSCLRNIGWQEFRVDTAEGRIRVWKRRPGTTLPSTAGMTEQAAGAAAWWEEGA